MDKVEAMHIKDTITTTDLFLMIIKAMNLCMWKKIPSITTVYWCILYWNKTEKINAVTTIRVVEIVSNSTHNKKIYLSNQTHRYIDMCKDLDYD